MSRYQKIKFRNWPLEIRDFDRGFSLVEIILSISIFVLIVAGFVGAFLYGEESTVLAGQRVQAVLLAEEGLEAVRNIRDGDFANLTDGLYGLNISASQWVLSSSPNFETIDIFTRQIEVLTIDSETKMVNSKVTWEQNRQRPGLVSLATYFTNWKRSVGVASLKFEVGSVVNSSVNWVTVNFQNTYQNPVVIIEPVSRNDSDESVVRIRNLNASSFEFRLQEPSCEDDTLHNMEILNYIVMEEGVFTLPDGRLVEAHRYESNTIVNNFDRVSFDNSYSSEPIVLSQVMSYNEADFVKTRERNASINDVEIALEEGEGEDGLHLQELIGVIVFEPGIGEINGVAYEFGKTPLGVTDSWYQIDFSQDFSQTPIFISWFETYNDPDTSEVRYRNLSKRRVRVQIEEDCTQDGHSAEVVGYVVFETAFIYP